MPDDALPNRRGWGSAANLAFCSSGSRSHTRRQSVRSYSRVRFARRNNLQRALAVVDADCAVASAAPAGLSRAVSVVELRPQRGLSSAVRPAAEAASYGCKARLHGLNQVRPDDVLKNHIVQMTAHWYKSKSLWARDVPSSDRYEHYAFERRRREYAEYAATPSRNSDNNNTRLLRK